MHHLVMFSDSIAGDGDLHELTVVPDSVMPPSDSGVLTSAKVPLLLAAGILGATVIDGELQSPSLRDLGFFDLSPVNIGVTFESPVRARKLFTSPIRLATPEGFHVMAAQGSGGSETDYAFVLFGDGQTRQPSGRPIAIAFDSSDTANSGAWSPITPVLRQALAAGRYAITGAKVESANGIAFRFIPNDSGSFRPGALMVQADDQLDWEPQTDGSLGVWMEFESYSIPNIEVFCTSGDSSFTGVIYLSKL
jgi:hypothetical protein